uniref:Uncharacterized protein n=1 Tax=Marseillevirus LCMAC202 TaxID=2506606 RepID=A0A481YXE7_9VIRU|nr:MAG: protein of unknown function DUF2738 [Marseillevirus LCMAC202]
MSSKTKKSGKAAPKKAAAKKTSVPTDFSKLKKDTRLIPIEDWDWARVVYSDPQKSEIPDGSGHYRRVRIQYMYDDETIGPAIVEFGKHYCFGVQPDNTDKDGKVLKDKNTGKERPLRGYQVPIVLTSQNKNTPDATDEEQREVDFLDMWRGEVVRYATENKRPLGKGAKNDTQIDGMVSELLYRKKDTDGNLVEDVAPRLYGKLIYYTNSKEVGTTFYGPGDKEINPLSMTGHFHIYPTLHFDTIFIGGKAISLQHRVYDATVEPITRTPKKRLARNNKLAADVEDFNEASTEGENNVNDMMESEEEEEEEDDE